MSHGTQIKKRRQTSDSFLISALLSFSGGLQDVYTYCLRDKVFSNAQTGNVVLMSQYFMTGYWKKGLEYMVPLIAFAVGVIVAEHIGHQYKNCTVIHWRQVVLFLETLILFSVGFIPSGYNMLASSLVSLACAMQVEAFKTVHGFGYASTMCIGNLRCGMESLSMCIRDKNKEALIKVYYYYGIIITFAIGAGVGGLFSSIMELKTIWISCFILIICCILMIKKHSIIRKSKIKKYYLKTTGNHSGNKDIKESRVSLDHNIYVDVDVDNSPTQSIQDNMQSYDPHLRLNNNKNHHSEVLDKLTLCESEQGDISKAESYHKVDENGGDMDIESITSIPTIPSVPSLQSIHSLHTIPSVHTIQSIRNIKRTVSLDNFDQKDITIVVNTNDLDYNNDDTIIQNNSESIISNIKDTKKEDTLKMENIIVNDTPKICT